MRTAFRRIMKERGWVSPGTRLLVGVSGGIDSMVLLHLLRDLSKEEKIAITVAHLNHGLRGAEAERDARFVTKMAREWGVAIETGREDVKAVAQQEGLSVQVAARKVRYRFFERVREKAGARWVVLGHNADDVAETMMMRWLRGTSVEGLRGIPLQNGWTIRPLLFFPRDEIQKYAEREGVPFVVDSSNRKTIYLRNRLRHELLPLIAKEYQPAFSRHLNRYAQYFSEIHAYLSSASEKMKEKVIGEEGEILLKPFRSFHVALQRVFLERYLLEGGWIDEPLRFEQLEKVLELMKNAKGSQRYAIGKGIWLIREYDRLLVTTTPACRPLEPVVCPVPGTVEVEGIDNRLTVEVVTEVSNTAEDRREAYVDGEKIGTALWVRSFRPGDRIVISGARKVKKLFIDRKIPARLRPTIPIVGVEDEIVWVAGVQVDRRFRARRESKRVLRLRFSRPIQVR